MKRVMSSLVFFVLLGAGLLFPLRASGAELSPHDVWIGDWVPRGLWPAGWEELDNISDEPYARVVAYAEGWVSCHSLWTYPHWHKVEPGAIQYHVLLIDDCPNFAFLVGSHGYMIAQGDGTDLDYDGDGIPDDDDPECDPSPNRPELNYGWADEPSLTCPTKAGKESVNVATGNHTERVVDISLSDPGIALEFIRFYNSQSPEDGPLGFGWTHNYNLTISDLGQEVLVWTWNGRALRFERVGETLEGRSGVKDLLEEDPGGGFVFTRKKTGWRYLFDPDGRLTRIEDLGENFLDLIYGPDTLEVRSNYEKSLVFELTDGKITTLRDAKGGEILYGHEGENLISVSYPDGTTKAYRYEDPNDPHNLTGELDTDEHLVGQWVYDQRDRTILSEGTQGEDHMALSYETLRTSVTDSRQNTKTFHTTIKAEIHLVKEIQGEGCSACSLNQGFRHDQGLNLLETTDGQGTLTKYDGYDENGNFTVKIEAFETPGERRTEYIYTYDTENPLLLRIKEERRASVLFEGGEKTTRWIYDGSGNLVSLEESGYVPGDGGPTLVTYRTTYGYNELGQLVWIDGPRTDVSDRTTFEYSPNTPEEGDNRGQIKTIVNALGQRTEFSSYDANGNVGSIIDPNGVVTLYVYDERNRVRTITNETLGATTGYFYDSHGNIDHVILPEGNRVDYTHDLSDRLTEIQDSLGNTIHYEYDTEGNRIREEVRDPDGLLRRFLDFTYDPNNRLSRIINPNGSYTEYTYDGNGNRISMRDPNTHTTSYGYDALNRLTGVTEPQTSYGYDSHDNLISVTDANGNRTDYVYDDFSRLRETLSPDTGRTTYGYDDAANLIEKTDAKGTVVAYTYDPFSRLTRIHFPDSTQDITYAYDSPSVSYGLGRLTGMTDPSGTSAFHYDSQGSLTKQEKQIGTVSYTVEYSYDKNRNLRAITYPSGKLITYGLDGAQRVSQVSATLNGQSVPLASDIAYLPFGGMTGLTYGNGLSLTQGYDEKYQTISIGISTIMDLAYTEDPNGNITEIQNISDPTRTQTFGYDETDRLVSATGIYGQITYGYDPVGNRLNQTAEGKTDTYAYQGGTNRLIQVRGDTPKAFSYDSNGNTLSEDGRSYTYDLNNRLISVSDNGTELADYVYNGSGQRVKKETARESRIFHYDLYGHLIAETDEDGKTLVEYVFLGDEPLAMIGEADPGGGGDPPGDGGSGGCFIEEVSKGGFSWLFLEAGAAETIEVAYYFHNDHLGTPQAITNHMGQVVWRADYEPFGEASVTFEGVRSNFRFPGQYLDSETGLHYNYFRDYHPAIGRYIESDPLSFSEVQIMRRSSLKSLGALLPNPYDEIGRFLISNLLYQYSLINPQVLTLYSYVQNHPLNGIDPLGLWSMSLEVYKGFGGGFVFGKNPGGGYFLSFKYGYGIGAGLTFNPQGTSPGWDPCREEHGLINLGAGAYGEATVGLGPFFAGILANAGVNVENPAGIFLYRNIELPRGLGWGWSLRAGAAAGGEITFY